MVFVGWPEERRMLSVESKVSLKMMINLQENKSQLTKQQVSRWKTRGRTRKMGDSRRYEAWKIAKMHPLLLFSLSSLLLINQVGSDLLQDAADSFELFSSSELIPANEGSLQQLNESQAQLNQLFDYSSSYLDDDPDSSSSADQLVSFQQQSTNNNKAQIKRRQVLSSDLSSDWQSSQADYDGFGSAFSPNFGSSHSNNRVLVADHAANVAFGKQQYSSHMVNQVAQSSSQQPAKQQQNSKMGPVFTREPPGFVYYLNSSDLVIPCAASGSPEPTITWWQRELQLESGSLLDKRYIRYDNALVISAFKGHEFQQELHSTAYKCQASNAFGTISSRDVVINAVIDQDFELSVADQFVTAGNDALFRCQLSPSTRDFLQVSAWLQDDQLIPASSLMMQTNANAASPMQQQQKSHALPLVRDLMSGPVNAPSLAGPSGANQRTSSAAQPATSAPVHLPDGQLLVPHVHLRDANKSYRCQARNLLNGKLYTSSIGGRLFVTDIDDQSGSAPRLIEAPKQTSVGQAGESMQLVCLAQGSPRPTVRWFKQHQHRPLSSSAASSSSSTGSSSSIQTNANNNDNSIANEWLELTIQNQQLDANSRLLVSTPDANLLQIRSLTSADQGTRFRCLANNSYGQQTATTELRLDLWPPSKLVELEPKVEYLSPINNFASQHNAIQASSSFHRQQSQANQVAQSQLLLNCTVRAYASQPLVGLEWLKNGRIIFAINNNPPTPIEMILNQNQHNVTSLFDLSEDKLESLHQSYNTNDQYDRLAPSSPPIDTTNEQQHDNKEPPIQSWQSVRFASINRDTLLYQLHLNAVSKYDRGAYQCRARYLRSVQQATSHLLLRDQAPQFIESFPSQLIARPGANMPSPGHLTTINRQHILHSSSVSLKCIASGSPLPEISWLLSGFAIPESSRIRVGDYVTRDGLIVSFVNISQIQVEDGGLYECSATNDAGQARHSAWLNVTGSPHIRPMANMNAVAGRAFQIMCPVGGWPIDQISWYQNSTKLPTNHRQKLYPNGTLVISELTEITDSGQYSCQAKVQGQTNDLVALGHLQLTIRVPPVVEPFQFAKSLHRGQRYNVMCTVVRGDLPVSIRWFKDGLLIAENNNYNPPAALQQQQQDSQVAIKQLDPYSSTLTFGSLESHHRGVYTCEAENEAGRANQSSALVIHVPPEWRIEPRDASITVGRTAVIDCQADAFPAARIEWRLSQDLYRESPSEFKPIISSLYMRVFENGSLIIYNTQRTDAGFYLCQATNGVGPGLSRVIKLTVNVAAHFKTKIRTELVKRGQPAKLRCESIGDPPIDINWLRDKQPLYAAAEPSYSVTKSQLADGLLSELYIPETDRTDSALFTCISQNQFGNDDTNIQLLVQGPPDPPLEIRLDDLKSRSVRLTWMPGHSGNSPLQRFIIGYAQLTPTTSQQSTALTNSMDSQQSSLYNNVSVAGNETSYVLGQLNPLTDYQFFIIAQNHLGSSRVTPSEILKFRTKDESPSSPLTMIKVQAVSSRAVRVKFRLPERRTHFGQPMGVYLGYKQLKPTTSNGQVADNHQTTSAPDHHLQSQSAAASNGAIGLGGFVFRTLELSGSTMSMNSSASSQPLDQECLLTGLKRGQRYLITLQPFNGEGTGPASEPLVVETWRVDVPDPPNLRLILRTSHSIHLAWRLSTVDQDSPKQTQLLDKSQELETKSSDQLAPVNEQVPSEPILGFVLTRKQLPNNLEQAEGAPIETKLPGEHMSQIIDNLQCGTRYQFTIVALNQVGASAPSEPLTIKTEGSVPVAPDKNSLLSLNSSSLMINLAAWYNGACPMRSFEVLFKQSKSPKWTPLTTYQPPANATTTTTGNDPTSKSSHSSATRDVTTTNSGQAKSTTNSQAPNNNNNSNQTIVIANLTPIINYDLKIIAINEAGSTEAYYTFNTNSGIRSGRPRSLGGSVIDQDHGENQDQSSSLPETLWGPSDTDYRFQSGSSHTLTELLNATPFLSWLIVFMLMIAASTAVCIFLVRRRHLSSSNCSLSLSTTSRTNRSSTNYYETSNKTTTSTSATGGSGNSDALGPVGSGVGLCNGGGHYANKHQLSSSDSPPYGTNGLMNDNIGSPLDHHGAGAANQVAGPWQHLDLYGTNSGVGAGAAHLSLLNKNSSTPNGAYGFMRPNNLDDHASDLTSVLGGTASMDGAETLCLGASALNLVGDQQQQHQKRAGKYYVSPLLVQAAAAAAANQQQQQQLNKLIMSQSLANKSATLPHNCNQQVVMQHLMQQQNQANGNDQHQRMIESLVAANNMQLQEQQHLSSLHDNSNNGTTGNYMATAENLALLEHQLQHQVYATVKRGCPKPPSQLRDYSIYQCPNTQQQQGGNLEAVPVSMFRCCGQLIEPANQHDHSCLPSSNQNQQQAEDNQQVALQHLCYMTNGLQSMDNQQQQLVSDYQQLKPQAS